MWIYKAKNISEFLKHFSSRSSQNPFFGPPCISSKIQDFYLRIFMQLRLSKYFWQLIVQSHIIGKVCNEINWLFNLRVFQKDFFLYNCRVELSNTVNVFHTPLPFYATQIIQGSQPIMIKWRDFSQWWNTYKLNRIVPLL